jgi:hypothetical protein
LSASSVCANHPSFALDYDTLSSVTFLRRWFTTVNSFTPFHFHHPNPYTKHRLKFTFDCCYVRSGGDDKLLKAANGKKQFDGAPLAVAARNSRPAPAGEAYFQPTYPKFLIANPELENDSTR